MFAAGVTIEPLNEWTAYEEVCRETLKAGDTDTYNTLFVHRPENMDVYLDCAVTDFGEDVNAFTATSHRGEVLIVPTSKVQESTPLREYLESNEGTSVGPFSVFAL